MCPSKASHQLVSLCLREGRASSIPGSWQPLHQQGSCRVHPAVSLALHLVHTTDSFSCDPEAHWLRARRLHPTQVVQTSEGGNMKCPVCSSVLRGAELAVLHIGSQPCDRLWLLPRSPPNSVHCAGCSQPLYYPSSFICQLNVKEHSLEQASPSSSEKESGSAVVGVTACVTHT